MKVTDAVPHMTAAGDIIEANDPMYVSRRPLLSSARWREEQAARIRAVASIADDRFSRG